MSATAGAIAISLESVGITYSGPGGGYVALRDVSTQVASGEFVVLVGPSGCGKSTLLNLIGGLLAPTAGRIAVGHHTPEQARDQRLASFVFQQPVLLPWHTARENVELPLRLFGWTATQRHAAADHFLELVGLSRFARSYPHQLSGGMQQRVAIARALSFEPSVLLMDEPFGALDELTRERLNVELLRVWSATRPTVLFVTHSLSEAVFLADRVLVLATQPGRIVAEVPIALPRPREIGLMEDEHFLRMVAQVRHHLNLHHALAGEA